jgi:hypothetical protein
LLITSLVCGFLNLIWVLVLAVYFITESKWGAVIFFLVIVILRIVELVMTFMMYGAVNTHNWSKMVLLIKIQVTMMVLAYLAWIVLSLLDDEGKPIDAIISFVFAIIITGFWVWYLCTYMRNGKLLQ